jgi:hypothetical protein
MAYIYRRNRIIARRLEEGSLSSHDSLAEMMTSIGAISVRMIRLTEEFHRGNVGVMSQPFHVILKLPQNKGLITKLVKLYLIITPCQLCSSTQKGSSNLLQFIARYIFLWHNLVTKYSTCLRERAAQVCYLSRGLVPANFANV